MRQAAMPRRCAAGSGRCRIGLQLSRSAPATGALLERLRDLGFAELVGIEPSREAARSAPADLRASIRIECFDPATLPAAHFTLVIVNQTIEHVPAPLELLNAAHRLLKPGGLLMLVSHNYRHWLMRLLGARSPDHRHRAPADFLTREPRRGAPERGFSELGYPAVCE